MTRRRRSVGIVAELYPSPFPGLPDPRLAGSTLPVGPGALPCCGLAKCPSFRCRVSAMAGRHRRVGFVTLLSRNDRPTPFVLAAAGRCGRFASPAIGLSTAGRLAGSTAATTPGRKTIAAGRQFVDLPCSIGCRRCPVAAFAADRRRPTAKTAASGHPRVARRAGRRGLPHYRARARRERPYGPASGARPATRRANDRYPAG